MLLACVGVSRANPYDGHTLGPVIADLEKLTRVKVRRVHGDKGYCGHEYPDRFKVWISGRSAGSP
jgi:transposase, IS5 family